MKLSIIIPYYKLLEETKRLFKVLEPQLDDEVEVIIVDDGCNEKELDNLKATVIHLNENSGGPSKPRNIGIEASTGKYIAFIDADDMITDDYILEIKNKIEENNDIIYLSWKSDKHNVVVKNKPPKWNPTVWSKVYKRELIDNVRFEEEINYAEDKQFNDSIKPDSYSVVSKQVYIYNDKREGSLSKGGVRKTLRIIFTLIGVHYTIIGLVLLFLHYSVFKNNILLITSLSIIVLSCIFVIVSNNILTKKAR